jgi:DNA polymerase III subunit beta
MQIIKATRDAVLKPLQAVAGIIERRHTMPILANVLITKDAEQVSFLGTDVEVQIRTSAALSSTSESGGTTVAARKLLDILRSLPDGQDVQISVTNKRMSITSGKSRFALQTLDAADFPLVTMAKEFVAQFSMPQKALKHLLAMVHFSMAQQDIRYYLNGVLLAIEGPHVRMVATDGHRLAYCAVENAELSLAKQEVIIPRKTVLELQRLLNDSEEPVSISLAPNQVRFDFGSVELVSKLVEGKFPDYQRVIPQGYQNSTTIERDVLAAALARAAILTSEKFKGVRFGLSAEGIKVQVTNAEQEEAVEDLDCEYQGQPLNVGFNITYLLDVLNNLKTPKVKLEFGDTNSSALLTVPGDEGFKYVVMPMRI